MRPDADALGLAAPARREVPDATAQRLIAARRGVDGHASTLVFVALPADNDGRLPIFETVLNGTAVTARSRARASTRSSACTPTVGRASESACQRA